MTKRDPPATWLEVLALLAMAAVLTYFGAGFHK